MNFALELPPKCHLPDMKEIRPFIQDGETGYRFCATPLCKGNEFRLTLQPSQNGILYYEYFTCICCGRLHIRPDDVQ